MRLNGNRRRVVITGVGVITPLGDDPVTLHGALCEGHSALHEMENLPDGSLPPTLAGELRWFDPRAYLAKGNLRPLDRTAQLCASAAGLALEASGWDAERIAADEVGLVLGTMFGSMRTISEFDCRAVVDGPSYAKPMHFANTVINAAAGQTAIWHGLRGINATISGGTVSGLQAIAYAVDLIRCGRARALLAGGAEELCFETLYGFHQAGLLGGSAGGGEARPVPLDRGRNGFALGEAAALLMLEDAESALARGARILAEVSGHGAGFDLSRGSDPRQGEEAVAQALAGALADAGSSATGVDAAVLSANGSVGGDRAEALGLERVWNGGSGELPVTAPKSMLGESLGASGALQVVVVIEAMRSGLLPGIHGLAEVEDGLPLRLATPESRPVEIERGLAVANGLAGKSCAVTVETWAS